jgi:hypothetical protein
MAMMRRKRLRRHAISKADCITESMSYSKGNERKRKPFL